MGHGYEAECLDCAHRVVLCEGGGHSFRLFRCDQCGAGKDVDSVELFRLILRYLRGIKGKNWRPSRVLQEMGFKESPGEPLTHSEYESAVDVLAGRCECGGQFRENGAPRCPACKSIRLRTTQEMVFMYD
jgi:hypothetical protein